MQPDTSDVALPLNVNGLPAVVADFEAVNVAVRSANHVTFCEEVEW
jgi:hypothetical protein